MLCPMTQSTAATLSDQLRAAIRGSGLSLYKLAKRTRVDHGQLSRFLRGERSITLETADRIAEELGLRLARSTEGEAPAPGEPLPAPVTPDTGEPAAAAPSAAPSPQEPAELAEVEAEPLRQLELSYAGARLLFGVVRWRRELAAEPENRPEQRQALKALAALFAEQKPPRGGSAEDVWTAELPLERCRRLRRVVGEFLAAGDERLEEEMRGLRAEWRIDGGRRLRADEEQEHRRRFKREIRAANGKVRRVRKRIPWR